MSLSRNYLYWNPICDSFLWVLPPTLWVRSKVTWPHAEWFWYRKKSTYRPSEQMALEKDRSPVLLHWATLVQNTKYNHIYIYRFFLSISSNCRYVTFFILLFSMSEIFICIPECCTSKTVGTNNYYKVDEDSDRTSEYKCKDGCIYKR